jgi:uncharacterized membrane protein
MKEVDVLEIALWVFCAGFVAKCVIFAFLTWTMRGQRNLSGLGEALRWHYISLSAQAAGLAFVFAYYASLFSGYESWMTQQERIAMYVIDTVLVLWATVQGVIVMVEWVKESHAMHTTTEREVA